jgi:hypothetical protein
MAMFEPKRTTVAAPPRSLIYSVSVSGLLGTPYPDPKRSAAADMLRLAFAPGRQSGAGGALLRFRFGRHGIPPLTAVANRTAASRAGS